MSASVPPDFINCYTLPIHDTILTRIYEGCEKVLPVSAQLLRHWRPTDPAPRIEYDRLTFSAAKDATEISELLVGGHHVPGGPYQVGALETILRSTGSDPGVKVRHRLVSGQKTADLDVTPSSGTAHRWDVKQVGWPFRWTGDPTTNGMPDGWWGLACEFKLGMTNAQVNLARTPGGGQKLEALLATIGGCTDGYTRFVQFHMPCVRFAAQARGEEQAVYSLTPSGSFKGIRPGVCVTACFECSELEWVDDQGVATQAMGESRGHSSDQLEPPPQSAELLRTIAGKVVIATKKDPDDEDLKPAKPEPVPELCDAVIRRLCQGTGTRARVTVAPGVKRRTGPFPHPGRAIARGAATFSV
ncbi:hypothetical protein EMIHUDRAFT_440097 [Emiliania huxleyi CCMP1516]|uniref:Uncharacterized protein n=2 Tax=Emiliania huxleyi TaxID=2903 RepID=A0A0D3KRP5_EMIH1|nr:hypothetical protein EMIHUDRAFT_440097 [Emiliania huxleyi CCMP1516]EOD38430.1 hypothetical protein EMIHUDRAFT_440097 [Emiliania huxleyi CCMP1516]|eukprot:XP_005790859.1 hypothetical protein EMIHUDRAFT_440097 [Emiliania huxleyi CCMP1516]